MNLDGSGYRQITMVQAGVVKWSPDGSQLAFDQTSAGGQNGGSSNLELVAAATPGAVTSLVSTPGTNVYPTYSRDGTWLYYSNIGNYVWTLWRVHPDGTGNAMVSMQNSQGIQFASVSPDGTKVSYALPGEGGAIQVLSLATGISTSLALAGYSTAWSPTSNTIAFVNDAFNLVVINSDGSGATVVSPGPYEFPIDWSPDGQWIIARNSSTRKLEVINPSSRTVMPLPFTGNVDSPAWQP